MNRLGLIHPDTMSGRANTQARGLYQLLSNFTSSIYGPACTTKLPVTGALVGSAGVLMHSPKVSVPISGPFDGADSLFENVTNRMLRFEQFGRAFVYFARAFDSLPALSDRVRAIVSLTVAVHEDAEFEVYARKRIATFHGLLTDSEIERVVDGNCPESFQNAARVAHEVAKELSISRGPLSQPLWDDAVDQLGTDGALSLVHHVGFHKYLATVLNGFDAQVPAESERVENT